MLDAIDYYNSAGGIVVFAAGNDNSESCYYPGCYDGVVGVAALDDSGVRASFSNYGDWVDISAPGDPVLSTVITGEGSVDSNYAWYSGTSMACPHVAGVLALGLALAPHLTSAELVSYLTSTATNVDSINGGYAGSSAPETCRPQLQTAWARSSPSPSSMPTPTPTLSAIPTLSAPSPSPSTAAPTTYAPTYETWPPTPMRVMLAPTDWSSCGTSLPEDKIWEWGHERAPHQLRRCLPAYSDTFVEVTALVGPMEVDNCSRSFDIYRKTMHHRHVCPLHRLDLRARADDDAMTDIESDAPSPASPRQPGQYPAVAASRSIEYGHGLDGRLVRRLLWDAAMADADVTPPGARQLFGVRRRTWIIAAAHPLVGAANTRSGGNEHARRRRCALAVSFPWLGLGRRLRSQRGRRRVCDGDPSPTAAGAGRQRSRRLMYWPLDRYDSLPLGRGRRHGSRPTVDVPCGRWRRRQGRFVYPGSGTARSVETLKQEVWSRAASPTLGPGDARSRRTVYRWSPRRRVLHQCPNRIIFTAAFTRDACVLVAYGAVCSDDMTTACALDTDCTAPATCVHPTHRPGWARRSTDAYVFRPFGC